MVPGHTRKIPSKVTCQLQQAEHHNLPLSIVVNRCVATTKVRVVPIILINTNEQNIWLWQPLLAAELFTVEYHPIEHRANMERKGNIDMSFLPVALHTIRVQLEQMEAAASNVSPPNSTDKPTFDPKPNTQAKDFDFEVEVQCLSFKLKFGNDAKLTQVQQSWFIDLIYDYPEVFTLHNEDLRFCDWIKHTILIKMDRPMYLPHHTIPPQLQGEVSKCLDTWLQQGIIRPSQSPYASQVVVVCKTTGEIQLYVDYKNLIPSW